MLAPSLAQAPYPSPRRKRQVSSIPLRLLSKSQSRCWIAILYFLCTSAQRGFFSCAAHTPAAGAQRRTQRQHAAHGAAQALDLLAGSIGPIFSTVGRLAPSALFRQMSRSPLLFRCSFETRLKYRFALEYQRFFGFDARSCLASIPRFRQGRSFPTTLLQGR